MKKINNLIRTNKTGISSVVALVLVLVVLLSITGIVVFSLNGKKDNDNKVHEGNNEIVEDVQNKNQKEDNNASGTKEITIDYLKDATKSKDSDFEYKITEDGNGVIITSYIGKSDIVVIPDKIEEKNVIEIDANAFRGNEIIRGVKLPDTIVKIGKYAFAACSNLEIVVMGENVKIIDQFCFNYCTNLKPIELNEKLEKISWGAFFFNSNLKEIYIPKSVTEIEDFYDKLQNITIIAEAGSEAEKYAQKRRVKYRLVEE